MNRQRVSWLMDMDGVIVREDSLVPGADAFVARLRETHHPFLILTNNSMYTTRDLAARLGRLGLSVSPDDIWTSALATAKFLDDQRPDGSAFVIGEAVLNAVRALHKPHEASEYGVVTASIGVATFGGSGDQTSMAELLRRADQALYGAKAAGRNRVHGWRPRLVEADREAEKRG